MLYAVSANLNPAIWEAQMNQSSLEKSTTKDSLMIRVKIWDTLNCTGRIAESKNMSSEYCKCEDGNKISLKGDNERIRKETCYEFGIGRSAKFTWSGWCEGLPGWAIGLIVTAVVLIIGASIYFCCCREKKRYHPQIQQPYPPQQPQPYYAQQQPPRVQYV
jgi:hypothetical protein